MLRMGDKVSAELERDEVPLETEPAGVAEGLLTVDQRVDDVLTVPAVL